MTFFRQTTSNNVVIMGRKTHDSLGRCLPNRYNIVLSTQLSLFEDKPNCVLRYGVLDALAESEASPKQYDEVFVIGGSTMYTQFDRLVDRYLITVVDKPVADADAFFDLSVLQNDDDWIVSRLAARHQGEGDEAPFEIFEVRSRNVAERQKMRQAEVEEFVSKRPVKLKRTSPLRTEGNGVQASFAL